VLFHVDTGAGGGMCKIEKEFEIMKDWKTFVQILHRPTRHPTAPARTMAAFRSRNVWLLLSPASPAALPVTTIMKNGRCRSVPSGAMPTGRGRGGTHRRQ